MTTTKASLPPGPGGLPIIGNLLPFQRQPLKFFRSLERKYGRMATVYIGKRPIVLVFRPEHIRYILTENARNFCKPAAANNTGIKLFLGDGLLTIDGDEHRQQRKLVQPAFHKHRVDSYGAVMTQLVEEMLASWQPGATVNIASEMQKVTLRIITKTLFNVDSLELTQKLGHAFDLVINGNKNPAMAQGRLKRPRTEAQIAEGVRTLDEFVYGLIKQRQEGGEDTGDVLSMLLAAQKAEGGMTDKQVHDHILTFVAAGHETAQNTLAWTFYLLSQHPQVQEKLLTELETVLHGRTPTLDDLRNLPYLEWVINEVWRFYPPAWRQGRQAIEDFEMDGYHFPAGTVFVLSQWVLHNLPDVWKDPENFRPERWDPANGEKVPQGAYFPFGMGSRICIGMPFAQLETRLLLATILQRYVPRLSPNARVVFQPLVTLRPKYGMLMQLEPNTRVHEVVAVSGK
ncbi:MAG TPA: cytochrome P450 [Ktedonobacteraceae bacterium]|nr:cytochrome P450 [Ktedonobacteraceae bacterium]